MHIRGYLGPIGSVGSIVFVLTLLFSSGLFSATAAAATRQWTGAVDANWSTQGNWNPAGVLADGDSLVFPSGSPSISFNDTVGVDFVSIRFEGNHNVTATGISVTGGIEVLDLAIIQGPLQLAANATITGTHMLAAQGVITAGDFSITGATLQAAAANNAINGVITIGTNGTFLIGDADALGTTPNTGVHLAGGTFDVNGASVIVNRLTGNGTVDIGPGPFGALRVENVAAQVFTGNITGDGRFHKLGAGSLTLGGMTSYTGSTTVHQGELILAHALAAANSNTVVMPDATLTFDAATTRTGALEASGTGVNGIGALRIRGGTVTQPQVLQLGGVPTSIAIAAPHQLVQQGSLNGPTLLTLIGGGTLLLGNISNTVTTIVLGNGTLPAPTLRLGTTAPLTTVSVTINAGATLDLAGFQTAIANLAGSGRLDTGSYGTGQVLGQTTFTGTFHGSNGSIVMLAQGQPVTLAGTHTLTGTFDTQSSHLTVAGTIPAAVASNGPKMTLAPGSMSGGARYSPILSDGQLIAGDTVNLGGAVTGALEIQGGFFKPVLSGTAPRVTVNGPVILSSTAKLDLTVTGPLPDGRLTLIANDGTDPISGVFANYAEDAQITLDGVHYLLSYRGGDGNDLTLTPPITSYHLSEGATGPFFDTDLLIANPWNQQIIVDVTFLPENASPMTQQYTLAPNSRRTIRVDQVPGMESVAFSTIVKPDIERTIAVERTMRWDETGYGGHTEKATSGPATTWYFAEGSEGFFRTFLLLANPQTTSNVARVRWLREGAPAIERTYDLAPSSRKTIAAIDDPELVNQAFGITVTFDQPGVAERAMYFGGPPVFKGGHESAGVTAPSTTWLLAEGATGDGFDTFILIANPGDEDADVTFTFLPSFGAPATLTRKVAAHSRITVNPEGESLSIPLGPVGTQVTATKPVIAERAQYWPLGPIEWTEAHNSFGVTEAAKRWVLAEGRVGGTEGYQTYILLANPGTTTALVDLTFLADGTTTQPTPRTVQVPPQQRVNVAVEAPNPGAFATFGTYINSDQPIVIERAMYWNVGGEVWAAGTNATATRMVP
jgi:autotransporter-associated beta strand protein